MTVRPGRVDSTVLPGPMEYLAYLPPGSAAGVKRYPVLYLLHGRGDSANSWRAAFELFDRLISAGSVPAFAAVAPDAPWSNRGGYWIDSLFDGDDRHEAGAAIATALVRDLVPHVDTSLPAIERRDARALCGYSMGGAGALSLTLGHQDLFSAAIALSPASYDPLPPSDSTARTRGAFGLGRALFDERRYLDLGYPAALASVRPELPVHLFLGVGNDEQPSTDPDALPPLLEVTRLADRANATPGITSEFHVVPGGHDWTTWLRLLEVGLPGVVSRLQ